MTRRKSKARSPYASPVLEEPYARRLKGKLQFHDLSSAERSLRDLDAAYRWYIETSDKTGAALVRSILLNGKIRAQSIAANPRVHPLKRREKREIALWFTVWLQTPDLCFDWLDMRKNADEFRNSFAPQKI
jgi:hypothetical protein